MPFNDGRQVHVCDHDLLKCLNFIAILLIQPCFCGTGIYHIRIAMNHLLKLIDWLTDWLFCAFYYAVDFVLKDPREKDDDKKEEVLEHKKE